MSLFRQSKATPAAAVRALQQLSDRLLSEAGTANSAAIAEQLTIAYAALPPEARLTFFDFLDTTLAPDRERVLYAAKAYA